MWENQINDLAELVAANHTIAVLVETHEALQDFVDNVRRNLEVILNF